MSTRRLAALACAILVLGGCAAIPRGGPVQKAEASADPDGSTVRYAPAGPQDDADPQQVVQGWLDAMLAYPATTGTAEKFLTPDARDAWDPTAGTTVYTTPQVGAATTDRAVDPDAAPGDEPAMQVPATLQRQATLDASGQYIAQASPEDLALRLERVRGEWRIANPPDGVLVTQRWFDDYVRPFDLYFLDRTGRRLVADPVHLVTGDALATTLMTSLMRGPQGDDRKVLRTELPDVDALRPNVPVDGGGVADVQLDVDERDLDEGAQRRLSAQVVRTLGQVEDVTDVRITDAEGRVVDPRERESQDVREYPELGPLRSNAVFATAGSALSGLRGSRTVPVEGPWGGDVPDLDVVVPDEDRVAAVGTDGTTLRVGRLDSTRTRTIAGVGLLTPRWDADATVWAVDAPGPTRLRLVADDAVREVPVGSLATLDVRSFALSPDETRYAVVVSDRDTDATQVMVGWVRRAADGSVERLGEPRVVSPPRRAWTTPRAVTWAAPTTLGVLATVPRQGSQVFDVAADGSSSTAVDGGRAAQLPNVRGVDVVSTRGDVPIRYVLDAGGRVWALGESGVWRAMAVDDVTGIATGR